MKPTIGRIVHYRLSQADVTEINEKRRSRNLRGNPVTEGKVVPAIVAVVWPDEFGPGVPGVNEQALLDGEDSLWICSRKEGTKPGEWSWPPRE